MKRKYLQTLIALVVLGALWGIFTYVNHKKSTSSTKPKGPTSQVIFPAKKSQIVAFTMTPSAGKPVTCVLNGKTWEITEPEKLATDSATVKGFLNTLTSATPNEIVSQEPGDLKEFGLAPPAFAIHVKTNAKPAEFTLLLGSSTPTNSGVYAKVAGQPRIFTLATFQKSSFEKNLFDLRNKNVVTLASDDIQRMDVTSSKGTYQLMKNADGIWDLMLPPPVRADHFTVEGLVQELHTASMKSVVEETKRDLTRYGFSKPTLTIHLTGDAGSQTLVLGRKDGDNYYAMNTAVGPVFTLGSDFLSQFQKKPSAMRSKDLFSYVTYEVNKLTYKGPKGQRVFVQHKNNKWGQTQPASMEVASSKMQTLLQDLRDLSAESFPSKHPTDLTAFGLTKPQYTFQVQYGSKKKTETVQISKVGGKIYARRATDLVPAELSKDSISKIQKDLGTLK